MAGRSDGNVNANNVVRQLLSRLDELSSIISPQAAQSDPVENEVRNVFNGNRRPPVSSITNNTPVPSITNNRCGNNNSASASTPRGQPQRTTPTSQVFMARRNFSGQRPSTSSRKQKKSSAIDNRPFMRDLILLAGPDSTAVPRQGIRLALMENGHLISGCKFTKGMTAARVEIAIFEAFAGKIPTDVDIDIMMSMHTKLVLPSLAPGQQGIDGAILQRLFQTKPIYVRPSKMILELGNSDSGRQVQY